MRRKYLIGILVTLTLFGLSGLAKYSYRNVIFGPDYNLFVYWVTSVFLLGGVIVLFKTLHPPRELWGNKVVRVGALLMCVGLLSNGLVITTNGGFMPASPELFITTEKTPDPFYIPFTSATRLWLLGDLRELDGASIGDCVVVIGAVVWIISILSLSRKEIESKGELKQR